MNLRQIFTVCVLASAALTATASDSTATVNYMPEFHSTVRAFFRQSTADGVSRFEVANARLSVQGDLMPWFEWKIQTDFCAKGKVKIVDAYGAFKPAKGLKIFVGQMRVPLSISSTRSLAKRYFVDAATPAELGSLRSVGIKAGYTIPRTKLYFEGGVFNATNMSDHSQWNTSLTYSIKCNWATPVGLKPEIGFMSRQSGNPSEAVRTNNYDASLSWTCGGLFLEGEYLYRRYAASVHRPSRAYVFLADYTWHLSARMANRLSLQGRFDGITDASSGVKGNDGLVTAEIQGYRRLTVGVTAAKDIRNCHVAFRINYEQYFYGSSAKNISADDNSQLVAGLIFSF